MQKIIPPFLFLISAGIMLLLGWLMPLIPLLPSPFHFSGLLLLATGIGMAKQGSSTFAKVGTNIETFQEPDLLVTDGLFSISRNPMYLGFTIALAGIALTINSLSSLLVAIAFLIITDRWYIRFEEEVMEKQFGEKYLHYKQQTRRWL